MRSNLGVLNKINVLVLTLSANADARRWTQMETQAAGVADAYTKGLKNPGIPTRVDTYYATVESTKSGFSDFITLTSPPSTSTMALSPALS